MKNVLFVVALLAIFAGAAWANCPAPPFAPSWWLTPDPGVLPDGATRTQFHSFIDDPNPPDVEPDCTYNGFEFIGQDAWSFQFTPDFNTEIPGGVGPANGDDGLGFAAPIDLAITKTMRNQEILTKDKLLFMAVTWWSADPDNSLFITCVPEPGTEPGEPVHELINPEVTTLVDPTGNGWRVTFFTGLIHPQPDFEAFIFNFDNPEQGGLSYVDSAWIGTTCIPEPSTIAMMVMGGLGVIGGVIRKFRR